MMIYSPPKILIEVLWLNTKLPEKEKTERAITMANEEERTESRDWAELPQDALSIVFRKLGSVEILWPAQAVCSRWQQLALQPHVWHRIDFSSMNDSQFSSSYRNDQIPCRAIALSRGFVEELYIGYWTSDEFLTHITDRTTGLRLLALIESQRVSGEGLVDLVARCPLLEELQIVTSGFSFSGRGETYGAVGRARPKLRRFRLLGSGVFSFFDPESSNNYDEDAFEIANNMPELRELQMIRNEMTSKGLEAILGKCLHLELLDIRLCYNVKLDSALQAKLAKVKTVRLPGDPKVYDGEFETRIGPVGEDQFKRDRELSESIFAMFDESLDEGSILEMAELISEC